MVCVTIAPWSTVDRSTCLHCGTHVTDRFRRVFGDDDQAHRCGDCDSDIRLSRGSDAGLGGGIRVSRPASPLWDTVTARTKPSQIRTYDEL
ncbi:DUF7563 family protein [Natrinema salaciae]|uniref:DUF7563 family protein n=1 Tax=Natrinema salaciae TaxID=1186196 RepID=UPI000B80A04E|nr:hypothetical protein [Natrinema salaciae]